MTHRILIFGTGSVGAVYAWMLSKSAKITTICRSNFDEASRNGFTIHSTLWGNDLKVKPVVARTISQAVELADGQPFDFVVIAAKALPTMPSTAELIRPAVSGDTTIVLIQNGIGVEEEFAVAYPANPLLSAVVYLPVTQISPAVVHHREVELLHVGTYPAGAAPKAKEAAQAFTELVRSSGGSVKCHNDIQVERWTKLLVNGSWNPICALTRLRDKQFLDGHDDALHFIRDVMLEICAVAQACGYEGIDEGLVDYQIGRACVRELPGVQPSMMADALAERSLEVEAIVGNVVRLAKAKALGEGVLYITQSQIPEESEDD
ncbi:hypothetical protein DL766_007276 [Monosporascus sp. MC13-8B]|uniref:2-dehydropantoate 2-reductase n=1 Tax=Monosporascus cannonballus TaxID=155416 RepID=A0ABY0GYV1_9PEZI|nr:hypothetical protein DL762_007587 [Monosporascus cannonballus]RYO81484.1 hypothetical protein DL763_008570 [Monosporascus cannonballus]RYP24415.1 hypothetical protein DL766_007276 [Monosporascus sp. MC13-8B]